MKKTLQSLRHLGLVAGTALALVACGGEDTTQPQVSGPDPACAVADLVDGVCPGGEGGNGGGGGEDEEETEGEGPGVDETPEAGSEGGGVEGSEGSLSTEPPEMPTEPSPVVPTIPDDFFPQIPWSIDPDDFGAGNDGETDQEPLQGDLTGDDAINVVDVQCMNQSVLAYLVAPAAPDYPKCLQRPKAADINCDQAINLLDLQLVFELAVQKTCPFSLHQDENGNCVFDSCEDR